MDGDRFDRLTRLFAGERNRRSLFKLLAGGIAAGAAGSIATDDADAASCRKGGEVCRKGGDCCSKTCSAPDKLGRQYCACKSASDCPAPGGCKTAVCLAGGTCSTADACTGQQICYHNGCCTPNAPETTCAQKCGPVKNNCGQSVDCGPCCTAVEGSCQNNADCCSNVCISGSCAVGLSSSGGSCDDVTDCAAGLYCCSGTCFTCCQSNDCNPYPNECGTTTCVSGSCTTTFESDGTPVDDQIDGDCKKVVCDGAGSTKSINDDFDPFDDGNQCTSNVCTNGVVSNPPVPVNTPCNQSGGAKCDGIGTCVQCTGPSDCPGQETSCQSRTCTNGVCGLANVPDQTPLPDDQAGDCQAPVCDGAGGITYIADPTDLPVTLNECQFGICTGSIGSLGNYPSGTACTGGVCDGNGTCVECVDSGDCGSGICCDNFCVDDTSNETCGFCENDCTLNNQICDGNGGCVDCIFNEDCTSGLCCTSNCVDPTADTSCGSCDNDCTVNGEICGFSGACVECNFDDDCSGTDICCNDTCYDVNDDGHCGTCINDCLSNGEICNSGTCVECLTTDDCSEGVCDTDTNTCVDCLSNLDCDGEYCNRFKVCVSCLDIGDPCSGGSTTAGCCGSDLCQGNICQPN